MNSYSASYIKPRRRRRTKAEIERIEDAIEEVVNEYAPVTVRQVFYQLVSKGAIEKTETEYNQTVVRLLTKMRREWRIDYGDIADNTRWMRKPQTHDGLEDALTQTAMFYRRDIWTDLDERVEVWLEKEALAGVLYEVTQQWHVPLMVTRGYPSVSCMYEASQAITAAGKDTFIYYFGDHDPSGVDIQRFVEDSLGNEFDVDVEIERVAVTPKQIIEMNLPTRPTKQSDTRAKGFVGESVEVDAINPHKLRELANQYITFHIPADYLEQLEKVEEAERETLEKIVSNYSAEATP